MVSLGFLSCEVFSNRTSLKGAVWTEWDNGPGMQQVLNNCLLLPLPLPGKRPSGKVAAGQWPEVHRGRCNTLGLRTRTTLPAPCPTCSHRPFSLPVSAAVDCGLHPHHPAAAPRFLGEIWSGCTQLLQLSPSSKPETMGFYNSPQLRPSLSGVRGQQVGMSQ